jgi:hypothetical protein
MENKIKQHHVGEVNKEDKGSIFQQKLEFYNYK